MRKGLVFILIFLANFIFGQTLQEQSDAFMIKRIHDLALTEGKGYNWLSFLAQSIGGRLSGSPQASAAVEYTKQALEEMELDSVWLQPCLVPHWVRGDREVVRIINSYKVGTLDLPALALGGSTGTGPNGITAEIIEVTSLDALDSLGRMELSGKIVFFNRPMDPTQLNTFNAYGGAVDQRVWGASRASKYGAVGALIRSITTRLDDHAHTGTLIYEPDATPIPGISISTNAANLLSDLLKSEPVQVYIKNNSLTSSDKLSYNVIGEIKGSTFPDEIILVGGHLDSWDVGEGAHDDGAGCVQAMDVLHIIKTIGYQPKRTIRCVLFMNEENGQRGAIAYKSASDANKEFHLAAIESDRGGFTPRGFTCDGDATIFNERFKKASKWLPLLEPYRLTLEKGGSGADISRLKSQKGLLFGFLPDSQRYFDFHHTETDVFEAINERELQLGSAAITSLVFLIDKYGL